VGPKEVTSPDPGEAATDRERFRSPLEHRYPALHSYILRGLSPARNDVADATAQVLAAVWRSRTDVPESPDDLLWFYGVTRTIVNRHGAQKRHNPEERPVSEAKVPSAYQPHVGVGPQDSVRTAPAFLRASSVGPAIRCAGAKT
jgi:hypothetical protein